jgi:pSer/pThr/pTyr-binding forkhead associated (FHA) protein
LRCKRCGAELELTLASCPSCGDAVELGRLTGILGRVCRACDAYNDPGAKTCIACGKPLAASDTGGAPAQRATDAEGGGREAARSPASVPGASPASAPASAKATAADGAAGAAGAAAAAVVSFGRSGSATRIIPAAALRASASVEAPAHTPIPLVTRCPRCGGEAGPGSFCAGCGQPLGARGTQVMVRAPNRAQVLADVGPGGARLVLERGEAPEGATFPLDDETVAAGRTEGTLRFAEDPSLAPHHATFFYRGGALHVRDEGAPGGVYLKLRGLSVPLRPGDRFAVGDRLLRYAGPLPAPEPPSSDGTRRLGAPRPAGGAVVIEEWLEGEVPGRTWVRAGPSVTIGRAGCAVSLGDDTFLSQTHAEILVDGESGARLRDLGSSNGTYLRLPPRAERELRDGDCLRLGREVLRVAVG